MLWAGFIRGTPMSNRGCDATVILPMDNKVVVVRGRIVAEGWFGGDIWGQGSIGGWFGGDCWLTTSGCCLAGVVRWIGRFVVWPGIAKIPAWEVRPRSGRGSSPCELSQHKWKTCSASLRGWRSLQRGSLCYCSCKSTRHITNPNMDCIKLYC